jgi:hypothetical protein
MMSNLKPFRPQEIDASLTRLVLHRGSCFLLFPFVNALGAAPKMDSVGLAIAESAATNADITGLIELVETLGAQADWMISFNTPWLVDRAAAQDARARSATARKDATA